MRDFLFMLSEKAIQKFKKLYEQRFKETLTDKEALRRATRLLNLYRAIYTPQNKKDYANRRKNHS